VRLARRLVILHRREMLAVAASVLGGRVWAAGAPAALRDYERGSGGRVGLYAENVVTGARISWRADERFAMCSSFKASLAACVLRRVDRRTDDLAVMVPFGPADIGDMWAPVATANLAKGALSVAEMCRAAVEVSDNACANLLLARIGGPTAMTAFWRDIGDTVSRLDHNEPLLNRSPPGDPRDTTTPAAMAGNFRRLVLGNVLSAESRGRLTDWLVGCQTGGNRLRAGLPGTWKIGDKTGNNGKDAAGDIAVAWPRPDAPVVVCAYTQGGMPSAGEIDAVFAGIGRMVGAGL